MRTLQIILLLLSATCFAITNDERTQYGMKMHEAFVLQSVGQSTKAFFTFQNGYMQASQLGEDPRKLLALLSQFTWYRTYGSYLRLFAIEPTGRDVISDQYQDSYLSTNTQESDEQFPYPMPFSNLFMASISSPLAPIPNQAYRCPDFPELGEYRRNYILGVGEIIVGLFLISRGNVATGLTIGLMGVDRVWDAVNPLLSRRDFLIQQELRKSLNDLKAASPKT